MPFSVLRAPPSSESMPSVSPRIGSHRVPSARTGNGSKLLLPVATVGHLNVRPRSSEIVDVVGPVCESGDFFAQDRELPSLKQDDLVALMSAGAYGFVMASNYNSRPLPAEVLVQEETFSLVRRRQTMEDLIRDECE